MESAEKRFRKSIKEHARNRLVKPSVSSLSMNCGLENSSSRRPPKRCWDLPVVVFLLLAILWSLPTRGHADPEDSLLTQEILVIGRSETLIGEASSAAEGVVGQAQLAQRPVLRSAEVLESVPGLIISQHSGTGKANQYYLRGFNLDHGTDFLTSIDGMPINLPTHGHGHGYTDLNFMIPELIESISYKKGPYYAEKGDFSSAGAADIHLFDKLESSILSLTTGTDDYYRALVAESPNIGAGNLLYAFELEKYNGPWDVSQDLGKINAIVRYSHGSARQGFSLTGSAYHSEWTSTDQIPARAVEQGLISRFGSLDPTDGGNTSRFSILGNWHRVTDSSATKVVAYGYHYRLNLFSNFTYFLDDPDNGDQFEQVDRRWGSGGEVSHQWAGKLLGQDSTHSIGFQIRNDSIPQVALFHTKARERLDTVRNDDVIETSAALYAQSETQWLEKVRTLIGARGDLYRFDVASNLEQNSGLETSGIVSPKFGVTFGPWSNTELYINAGTGFHSNDARGTTITVDPSDSGSPADRVDPLVRSKGAEIGVRTAVVPGLVSTLSLWNLDLDSELLFIGDAGTTEASRPSRRNGLELANYYKVNDLISLDADFSLSRSYFKDSDPSGRRIPGSVESVVTSGISLDRGHGFFSQLRLRYFGPRSLIEDNSERSSSTVLVNGRLGYHFGECGSFKSVTMSLDAFNLFDRKASDIDYYYGSRLPGESASGVEDRHFHPAEPAEFRLTLTATF